MINAIIDGICKAIYDEFGEDYEIYTESIEQGLQEPCFFILCLNPSNEQFLGKRYYSQNLFNIQYFPVSNDIKQECNDVIGRLFNCLEQITVTDDLIRGTDMKSEIIDNVLNFQVNYNFFVQKKQEDVDLMENHTINTDIKKE